MLNLIKMNKLLSLLSIRRTVECRALTTKLTADGKEIPKRKIIENRITLIGTDNSVSITDLKDAQNLSVRRELKLVKIQDVDSKTRRPVYKLMSTAEYHEEELQRRKEKQASRLSTAVKGAKLMTLSSRIGEHDLMTGIKKMLKLLDKHYEVKIVISGEAESDQNLEKIYSVIEGNTKSGGKIVQKRNKGNNLRFQLLPSKDSSTRASNSDFDSKGTDRGPL